MRARRVFAAFFTMAHSRCEGIPGWKGPGSEQQSHAGNGVHRG
jgi:hypothetical protein